MKQTWIVGLMTIMLAACGVTQEPVSAAQESSLGAPAGQPEAAALAAPAAPAAVCSPGDEQDCCPFATGCSCDGTQVCSAIGRWSLCIGAIRAGQVCP